MGSTTAQGARPYAGPERRRNQVLVTRNSEYYCHDGTCVAVRDRSTGSFVANHSAIGKQVTGGMRFRRGGGIEELSPPGALVKGEQLCFSSCDGHLENDVITSALFAVERPPKGLTPS
jgi:hypothetical protein